MKKFVSVICVFLVVALVASTMFFRFGVYIDFNPTEKVKTAMTTDENSIYMNGKKFEIRGVDMGDGIPGKFATDYAVDYDTYLKWFDEIAKMGANTLRVYIVQSDDFYNALYDYNKGNDHPLYLIQGVWINDYVQNSHVDAYDDAFFKQFKKDCKTVVNVLHGRCNIAMSNGSGSGTYLCDVSPWCIGYILGVEWEDVTVAYTNEQNASKNSFKGKYMYTTNDATPFEAMLAGVGDSIISYESTRYKEQRLVAFSNWPTTDPFTYPDNVSNYFMKCAYVDTEHIKTTNKYISGQFASYHVYPYYPDYLSYVDDPTIFEGINTTADMYDDKGRLNTYRAYLKMLTAHHNMPVIISEFGVSTGRGMAQRDKNTNRNQGNMSESGQGQAIVDCYNDIMAAGCAGCAIFSWQDEWFKRTWNTMYAVDLSRTPYWSDYQTNEQYFGLLSFDPGDKTSICYVDGNDKDWSDNDKFYKNSNYSLSAKYDEKFVYLKVDCKDVNSKIYIPIDTTQKSGSNFCKNFNLKFERQADFIICLNGKDNSRVMVQERYEVLRSTYLKDTTGENAYTTVPDKTSPLFKNIDMILQTQVLQNSTMIGAQHLMATFETGKLTYGNANPKSDKFNSLADFCYGDGFIEIKLPWQLLNFYDPSKMQIHDDYYQNYGVKPISIDKMYFGVGSGSDRIKMSSISLNRWNNKTTSHQRLKSSYYIVKDLWTD